MQNKKRQNQNLTKPPPPKRPGELNFSINTRDTTCNECGENFTKPSSLKCHLRTQHTNSNVEPSSSTGNALLDDLLAALNREQLATPFMTEVDINRYDYSSGKEYDNEDDNEYNRHYQDDQVFEPDFENDVSDHNALYNSITNYLSSFDNNDDLDLENESDNTDTETDPANLAEKLMTGPISGCHPFSNLQTMTLKKLLFTMNMLLKIQTDSAGQGTFKLPKLNALMKYQHNKKNRIPILSTVEVKDLTSDPPTVIAEVTLPSTHIELFMANPEKCKKIFSLPDQTPDQSTCFQQGEK
ncbi:C2H2-type zinc finger transcription factor [Phycomyces blakesleeanus]|uniref:C2H2-type zinc finger transcription factor n=2 Tax=Phycomyces blakesleeanus TaxID=4837 RepID=A0A162TWV9_PHYB8|nr:C2H2-type zinc finger transcription factor [Phycomyces blakesleeanus NRRL 1555(-)]OAD71622.1 C2H2-type zinc finger transcription factor [Phycomyces blakesleeanus NRRL 1555(-)]|eukprot:XP_018289662.1 C2H2-type zinc finger transcription factor [Phycomyces blakesleeanus NRRL 1555(-)]